MGCVRLYNKFMTNSKHNKMRAGMQNPRNTSTTDIEHIITYNMRFTQLYKAPGHELYYKTGNYCLFAEIK